MRPKSARTRTRRSVPTKPPPPHTGRILLEREGPIATVIISHDGKLNALSIAMWRRLAEVFGELSADRSLRCVLVRGSGAHFAAGADITEFAATRMDRERAYHYHQVVVAPALRQIAECAHPTVAMIRGVCVGGGFEIACCCDLRIAGASVRMGIPINQLGFPAAPEELRALLALAGRAVTLELLLEGRILKAAECLRKGLVTRVVKDARVESAARDCARRMASGAPQAARLNKELVRRLPPGAKPLGESELRDFFAAWAESADHREGVRAFLEKRRPQFSGEAR